MYGTEGSSTYLDEHMNTNSSYLKDTLDGWYETYIENQNLDKYVADSVFCNDRTAISGTGYGTDATNYGAYERITNTDNVSPVLKCPQKNDAFTVSDTNYGNGALAKKVGVITADEMVVAGARFYYSSDENTENTAYYLYKGGTIWTMTPLIHQSNYTYMLIEYYNGSILFGNVYSPDAGIAPVINLTAKYASTLKGSGTMDDPYTAK
jgi:hypothetical protein